MPDQRSWAKFYIFSAISGNKKAARTPETTNLALHEYATCLWNSLPIGAPHMSKLRKLLKSVFSTRGCFDSSVPMCGKVTTDVTYR